jgi:hypothetical protein
LVREAWDNALRAKGLLTYHLSNDKKAWYVSREKGENYWFQYTDMDHVQRKKRLVGHSSRRSVYWHYAMEAWPSIGRQARMVLKPHVVFSEDGQAPLSDDKRMHSLRRGFCKGWWNARWRDLMLAYVAAVGDEHGGLSLPLGSDQGSVVDLRPTSFWAPVSLGGISEITEEKDITDEDLDALDEEPDWQFADDFEEDRDEDMSNSEGDNN